MNDDDRATILIVEDDEATRRFLGDNLTADGHDVLVADTGRDGLRMLEYKYPDVAVVDLALPDVDGLDLIARVRGADGVATRINPDTPLLVLTGRDGELDRLRGFERRGALGAMGVAPPQRPGPACSGPAPERHIMNTPSVLDGAEFYGTSRSFTHRSPGLRSWPTCRRCGSTLTGRNYKGIVLRRLKASTYTTQAYQCRCGAHRYMREAT